MTTLNGSAHSREQADKHITSMLGGPVADDTLRLLWTASQGDSALAYALVRGGLELGELARHGELWRWGEAPDSVAVRWTELVESRATVLTDAQLEALERMVRPLAGPHEAIERARLTHADAVRLTPREHDVLGLLCEGLSAVAISRQLGLSSRTVTKHQERLYRKLGTSDRLNAVLLAQRLGIVGARS
jgi:DNA-binding CsgD family transcriptional regulator